MLHRSLRSFLAWLATVLAIVCGVLTANAITSYVATALALAHFQQQVTRSAAYMRDVLEGRGR